MAVNTRPDIAVAVSILGRKTSCSTQSNWVETRRILRYLKSITDYKFHLGANSSPLEVYVDTGYLFQYAGGYRVNAGLWRDGPSFPCSSWDPKISSSQILN